MSGRATPALTCHTVCTQKHHFLGTFMHRDCEQRHAQHQQGRGPQNGGQAHGPPAGAPAGSATRRTRPHGPQASPSSSVPSGERATNLVVLPRLTAASEPCPQAWPLGSVPSVLPAAICPFPSLLLAGRLCCGTWSTHPGPCVPSGWQRGLTRSEDAPTRRQVPVPARRLLLPTLPSLLLSVPFPPWAVATRVMLTLVPPVTSPGRRSWVGISHDQCDQP